MRLRANPKYNCMEIKAKITNRAALRSGVDIEGNQFPFEVDPGDLPDDVGKNIADRLYEDTYLCVAVLDKDDNIEPSVSNAGPDLLIVDGTELKDLIEAVRQDQAEVEAVLQNIAAK
jgi:hypothetical protein